jgi:hypothetical protein
VTETTDSRIRFRHAVIALTVTDCVLGMLLSNLLGILVWMRTNSIGGFFFGLICGVTMTGVMLLANLVTAGFVYGLERFKRPDGFTTYVMEAVRGYTDDRD